VDGLEHLAGKDTHFLKIDIWPSGPELVRRRQRLLIEASGLLNNRSSSILGMQ
jgi:hypothetical protein